MNVNGLQYHDDLGGEKTQKKLMMLKLGPILQDHNIDENSFHRMFHCEICRPNRALQTYLYAWNSCKFFQNTMLIMKSCHSSSGSLFCSVGHVIPF